MYRRKIIFLVIFIILVQAVSGQEYFTHGITPDLHLEHKVAAKETWYSIGRMYNVTPGDLASYNRVPIDRPLDIGQSVKIPLTTTNFSQDDRRGSDEMPVYHIVKPREWMYRISVNHNKVPIERLEKWNGISRDNATAGTKLIVGYLKVKGSNTSVAGRTSSENNTSVDKQTTTNTGKVTPEERTRPSTPAVNAPARTGSQPEGGYFSNLYDETGKRSSGVAGIFKSTSGWKDGKYYALISNVTVGTIVRITFPQTRKSIYAKVLGELPDMKESAGLRLRLSDSAAGELGAVNGKFSVDIEY